MNLFAISSLLCGSFCFLLAIFLLLSGKTKIYRMGVVFNFAVSIWGFATWSAAISTREESALIAWRIANSIGHVFAVIFYQLVSVLCGIQRKKAIFLGYFEAAFFVLLTLGTDLVINRIRIVFNILYFEVTPFYTWGLIIYLIFVILSFKELAAFLKRAASHEKRPTQYLFYSCLIGFIGGTSTILPGFHFDRLYPAGNLCIFIYASVVTYVILRMDIFDIAKMAGVFHREKLAMIGTLATSINHEIRNPLYIIQGLAESHLTNLAEGVYATKDQIIEKSSETLQKTNEQAARAMDIMKRFAVFAKQGMNETAQIGLVDLNETTEDVLALVCHEMELDKIQLIKDFPADLPQLHTDRRHLEEILFNLIVNACQAMKNQSNQEKNNRIQLEAWQHNGSIQIKIEDNGPGIPSDKLPRIFEPFYTTKEEGTGLGLYVTKQLVEKNGGRITVRSKLNEGTRFILEFKR